MQSKLDREIEAYTGNTLSSSAKLTEEDMWILALVDLPTRALYWWHDTRDGVHVQRLTQAPKKDRPGLRALYLLPPL